MVVFLDAVWERRIWRVLRKVVFPILCAVPYTMSTPRVGQHPSSVLFHLFWKNRCKSCPSGLVERVLNPEIL